MLITGDKKVEGGDVATPEPAPGETPPPYEPSAQTSLSDGPGLSSTPPGPPNIPATNCTQIKRKNGSVKGTYVIDAGLRVPGELLSATDEFGTASGSSAEEVVGEPGAEVHKNLHIDCTNGSITADVWLVDGQPGEDPALIKKKAELEVRAKNGSVNLKLNSTTSRPFALVAGSKNGSVSVALPSDFVGPAVLTTLNGSVSLSASMKSKLVTFSEENGTRKCFIGDYRSAGYSGKQDWTGSEVTLWSNNGRVRLSFVDEEVSSTGSGFLRRLFGY